MSIVDSVIAQSNESNFPYLSSFIHTKREYICDDVYLLPGRNIVHPHQYHVGVETNKHDVPNLGEM